MRPMMLLPGVASARRRRWDMKVRAKKLSRIGRIFADGRRIDEALRSAARKAIRAHAVDDAPVVIWRDGHVQWVPARELSAKVRPKGVRRRAGTSARGR